MSSYSNDIPENPAIDSRNTIKTLSGEARPIVKSNSTRFAVRGPLEIWNVLFRKKTFLAVVACTGALLGFVTTLFTPRMFQARSTIEVVSLNQDFLNAKNNSPIAQNDMAPDVSEVQTQITLLQSDLLLDHTLRKFPASFSRRLVGSYPPWPARLFPSRPDPFREHERTLSLVARNLQIRAVPQTRIIEARYESPDPNASALFLNALADEFIHEAVEARRKMSEQTTEWLRAQLTDRKDKLQKSEDQLQQYARDNNLMIVGDEGNVSEERLKQLEHELEAARTDRITKQTRFEMISNNSPESIPDILNDQQLQDSKSQLIVLRRQLAELISSLLPSHPRVERIQAQIDVLEAAVREQRSTVLNRIKKEFEEAQRKESMLSDAYRGQIKIVNSESERAVQYHILKREVDTNRQLYDAMLQRFNQAAMVSGSPASNIRLVDPARVPRRPSRPNVLLASLTGLFIFVFMGGTYVVVHDSADRRLQQWGETSFYLSIPELGVIPSAEGNNRFLNRLRGLTPSEPDRNGVMPIVPSPNFGSDLDTVVWDNKYSSLADSFRSALISVVFSRGTSNESQVVVVTSPAEGDGKSTVACNLAIAGAELGHRVLLVDADMRKPRVHRAFGVPNDYGLSNIVQCGNTEQKVLKCAFKSTHVPRLTVLCSGSARTTGPGLFAAVAMTELVRRFRGEFDLVIFDSPPALQIPDARMLGKQADGIIMVVRADRTTRDVALATVQRFAADGTRVLGTVLNDLNPDHGLTGYFDLQCTYSAAQSNQDSSLEFSAKS